ncbi:hypothetical protein [cf. Phormidesmis sp. LEGE 11477]|uniref:hypothetical protein n=1 Tax=cf. Phormidesmis sp. LEGE 11477 TaxID=1828680 RepID=UPI001881A73E|nr:hypothetical protein [cf. Phormidesmis sp. LEGE 11477]MBE9062244.1 hypothetical protein [cf. Phormidesmis sp. LEGE 11477]
MINLLIWSNSFYLAVDGATELVQDAMGVNKDAIASWNERWETIFDSGLFSIIVQMSIYPAVIAIVIWMTGEIKDFDKGEVFKRSFYPNLMWAMCVIVLLNNNGAFLADGVQGLHRFGQVFNQQALSYQLNDVALEDAIRASVGRGDLTAAIQAQLGQCKAYVGQEQYNCLINARQQIGQRIDTYENEWLLDLPDAYASTKEQLDYLLVPGGGDAINAIDDFAFDDAFDDPVMIENPGSRSGERVGEAAQEGFDIAAEEGKGIVGRAVGAVSGAFLGALGSIIQGFTHGFLLAVQWGFVNSLEMAMLLTGLVAPFAIALSFIPGTGRPIIAWLLAYASMVMVQFYYNIFIGIIGVVIVNSNAHDMNGYLLVLAVFAPVLAIKLAQGGGVAVFEAISSGSVGSVIASVTGAAKAG